MSGIKAKIEEANQKTLDILFKGQPVLVDIRPALDVVPGMTENMVLHSAPPIEWERMCGPHRHGIAGAVVWEGLADTKDDAVTMIERGEIMIEPCHHHDTVGAGAGITSATTPMLVVENKTFGNRAYSCLSEGGGLQLIKWGSYDEKIAENLHWQAKVLRPVLQAAVLSAGGVDIKSIISKAVQMGDECHNRSIAASAIFFREIAPHLLHADANRDTVLSCTESLAVSEHFFLHAIMAAAKAMLDPAKKISYSTVVTAMARNGVEFGIQVGGLDDMWFTAPANDVDGLFFRSEWGPEDAAPDLGDSCITETVGLGGFIQAAAPTVQQYVQGSMQQAIANTNEMREICVGTNQDVQIPAMDFAGAPIGIDIRKVAQTRIAPLIDTAITHKEHGLIGAGQVRAPLECFDKALKAYSSRYAAA
ncbi:MAG: DUF1116 domain-containing protein [Gammaproteobacteria bacterium]|nr:DUF1116 domain-containing protein [Gammaproteobacteria bacterium]